MSLIWGTYKPKLTGRTNTTLYNNRNNYNQFPLEAVLTMVDNKHKESMQYGQNLLVSYCYGSSYCNYYCYYIITQFGKN